MSLVGKLADLGLGDIFQILGLSRRSGTLQVNTSRESGEIVIKEGLVVAAFRTGAEESVAEALINAGLMSVATAQELLSSESAGISYDELFVQHNLARAAVERALGDGVKATVLAMMEWGEGGFSFVLEEGIEPRRGFSFKGKRFFSEAGHNPQFLTMEASRLRDERRQGDSLERFLARDKPSERAVPSPEMVAKLQAELGDGESGENVIPFRPRPRADAPVSLVPPTPAPVPPPAVIEGGAVVEPRRVAETNPIASPMSHPITEPTVVERPVPPPPPSVPAPVMVATPSPVAEVSPVLDGADRVLLIVDDDPAVPVVVQRGLQKRFARVRTATSVAEAMPIIQELGPRLVLAADLIMSRSDNSGILGGLELLEAVRATFADVPVVLFSDYPHNDASVRANRLGVTRILTKPRRSQLLEGSADQAALTTFLGELAVQLAPYMLADGEAVQPSTFDLAAAVVDEMDLGPAAGDLPPAAPVDPRIQQLRSLLAELVDPANRDTVTLLVLRYAATLAERAALFLVTRQAYVGLGGFCVDWPSDRFVSRVRSIQIPGDADSVFAQVSKYRSLIRAPLAESDANFLLVESLGSPWHKHPCVVVPLLSGGRVAAILFCDNPSGKDLGPTDGLEIFMQQAGLVMDRSLLERRLEEAQKR